ncbi:unnamed protein product [Bemisia tabaci]|uniref:WD repeat-containing protein 11 n=1 Tax=Bemisia tabaci TaxID=7038 RepID=A0A9P0EXD9_BEMTA|nr:unnamed protein product [Bemisia tabaci]
MDAMKLTSPDEGMEAQEEFLIKTKGCPPRIIPGPAHPTNKGSISWGHQGFIAYGSNTYVIVMEPATAQHVQVFKGHKTFVKKVAWAPYSILEKNDNDFLTLASGDESGQIIIWSMKSGKAVTHLMDCPKPTLGLEWIRTNNKKDLILAALHAPYFLVLWDVNKKTKMWKQNFPHTLVSLSIDPFDSTRLAFLCTDGILFLNDFNWKKIPPGNGTKLYISSPKAIDRSCFENSHRTRERLKMVMKTVNVSHTKPKSDAGLTVEDCIEIHFHHSLKHLLIVLYPRDILIIDLKMETAVGIVSIEQSASPFIQLWPARQRDVLYCVHESGSVSVKTRSKLDLGVSLASPLDAPFQNPDSGFMWYETLVQSDFVRQMKGSRILGISVCPLTESKIALVVSSGKVTLYELENLSILKGKDLNKLSTMLPPSIQDRALPLKMRLLVCGVLSGLLYPLTVLKVAPAPSSSQEAVFPAPIVAVGSQCGSVQLFSPQTGEIFRELALHNYPVRGIEWCGHNYFISWAYQSADTLVQNEVFVTNIETGNSVPLRADASIEPPIEIIKVSHLKQYFILVLKDRPVELWDLEKFSLLRTMSKKFPFITALEWSPVYKKKRRKSSAGKQAVEQNAENCKEKEYFVMRDTESCLYHFTVENNSIVEGVKIPSEAGLATVTCIAWKNNKILQADSEGLIHIWDLKARCSNGMQAHKGPVIKMCFAPGKHNFKLLALFNDSLQLADVKGNVYNRLHMVKMPEELPKVIDIDWADSETPLAITEDGCCYILDDSLSNTSSPLGELKYAQRFTNAYDMRQENKSVYYLENIIFRNFEPNIRLAEINDLKYFTGLRDVEWRHLSSSQIMILTAHMFGCQAEIDFWTVADYYLQVAKVTEKLPEGAGSCPDANNINLFQKLTPLDTCYDFLCDNYSYKQLQLERICLQEWRRTDYEHSRLVIKKLILLNETDKAVQFLLETDFDHPNYYVDAIKACLIATIQSGAASQSTIKLVATNLIANGKIWEGVELLCLIGKGLDACRYLLSYNQHASVIWLAKAVLPTDECKEVMMKVAEHFLSQGNKDVYVLILISLLEFDQALQFLVEDNQWEQALVLYIACEEHEVPVKQDLADFIVENFIVNRLPRLCNFSDAESVALEINNCLQARFNMKIESQEQFQKEFKAEGLKLH